MSVISAAGGLIVFTGGVIGLITSTVDDGWSRVEHWLPAVIAPIVLGLFGVFVWKRVRRLARDDEQYLRQWLVERLLTSLSN